MKRAGNRGLGLVPAPFAVDSVHNRSRAWQHRHLWRCSRIRVDLHSIPYKMRWELPASSSGMARAAALAISGGADRARVDSLAISGDTAGGIARSGGEISRGDFLMNSMAFRTESAADGPLFFIGCPSPAKAAHFARCMVSV